MCLSVGLGFWAVAPANCQTSAGAIVGVIRDESGAAVPGARITTTNQGTNISSPFVTDETGNYYIPSLLPGRYRVEAEKKGFKKVTARDIEVAVNQTVRVDLDLPVGDTSDSVSVVAETPLVQADQATIGQVVNNRSVSELPLNGRENFNLPSSHFYSPLFPVATPTATNFGSLTPVGGDHGNLFNPRIIQFGLKLLF
jgi:hypothetical protein